MARNKRLEILLVDDSPPYAEGAKAMLAGAELANRVHVARDGAEGLAFLRREGAHAKAPRPDLVLLDLDMPGMDGRATLRAMKEDPDLAAIPVVILTSSENESDVIESYQRHSRGFVSKEVDLREFVEGGTWAEDAWLGFFKKRPRARAKTAKP